MMSCEAMQEQPLILNSVLILEDDAYAQARLQRLLGASVAADARITVAGDLTTAHALMASEETFDLTLVDVLLPDGNGVDFIGWLRVQRPQLPAVIVSSWAGEATILAALRNGAIGYLLKSADDAELTMQLHCLQRGGAAIDPLIARRLLEWMPQTAPTSALNADAHLSDREVEILRLVACGLSNREIAKSIDLSKLTIESHTRNIYRKLAVSSRTAAVFVAQARGLLN